MTTYLELLKKAINEYKDELITPAPVTKPKIVLGIENKKVPFEIRIATLTCAKMILDYFDKPIPTPTDIIRFQYDEEKIAYIMLLGLQLKILKNEEILNNIPPEIDSLIDVSSEAREELNKLTKQDKNGIYEAVRWCRTNYSAGPKELCLALSLVIDRGVNYKEIKSFKSLTANLRTIKKIKDSVTGLVKREINKDDPLAVLLSVGRYLLVLDGINNDNLIFNDPLQDSKVLQNFDNITTAPNFRLYLVYATNPLNREALAKDLEPYIDREKKYDTLIELIEAYNKKRRLMKESAAKIGSLFILPEYKNSIINYANIFRQRGIINDNTLNKIRGLLDNNELDMAKMILDNAYKSYSKRIIKERGRQVLDEAIEAIGLFQEQVGEIDASLKLDILESLTRKRQRKEKYAAVLTKIKELKDVFDKVKKIDTKKLIPAILKKSDKMISKADEDYKQKARNLVYQLRAFEGREAQPDLVKDLVLKIMLLQRDPAAFADKMIRAVNSVLRSGIRIGKDVTPVGGLGDYEIRLNVKNISKAEIEEDYTISDYLPDNFKITDLKKDKDYFIDEQDKNIIHFKPIKLNPGEEKVIVYHVHGEGDYHPSDLQKAL